MREAILGISAFYHDSAAAIIVDGKIIAAAHEERFTRKKHDSAFPKEAIKYVLAEANLSYNDLSVVSFYDKPYLKFERLLETYHAFAPKGLNSFLSAIPVWVKEKLFMKRLLKKELANIGDGKVPLVFPEHHLSHAASAFFPSPFEEAAILTIDGVGEWATTTIGKGEKNKIFILDELRFPHSIGLLYSSFTYYTGFRVNSGEYKLMGLAPYGNRTSAQTSEFKQKILSTLVDIREDGSILLNMDYFNYATGLNMCNNKKWEALFGIPPRPTETEITQPYMNMALAIQQVTEEIVLALAKYARARTGCENLVMAGGVALNSVVNGKLLHEGIFDNIWIQPASGDAGGALGAALAARFIWFRHERPESNGKDQMNGSYLGPDFDMREVKRMAQKYQAQHEYYDSFEQLAGQVAKLMADGKVVGWFQGRMEFGPRALGNRSILGDARNSEMQKKMNLKIKYREGFRPFAPSVLEEDIQEYFDIDIASPYMLMVVPVQEKHRNKLPDGYNKMALYDRLYCTRSDIPAVTHIDFSARLQSVNQSTNPRYWTIINEFKKVTGYGVLINTSFNVRGEPIVCNPEDAYRCFMRTEMDYLVIGNFFFDKQCQPKLMEDSNWQNEFVLD
ncbi:MAG: carbamoyltransferase [Pseudomonadota bacterium]